MLHETRPWYLSYSKIIWLLGFSDRGGRRTVHERRSMECRAPMTSTGAPPPRQRHPTEVGSHGSRDPCSVPFSTLGGVGIVPDAGRWLEHGRRDAPFEAAGGTMHPLPPALPRFLSCSPAAPAPVCPTTPNCRQRHHDNGSGRMLRRSVRGAGFVLLVRYRLISEIGRAHV